MTVFERLRQDHDQLMILVEELSRLAALKDPPSRVELYRVRTALASRLIRHLKEEDWVVYPSISRSDDHNFRETARTLQSEVGGLTNAFTEYMARWTAPAIELEWPSYCIETSALLKALKRRMAREDTCLYGAKADRRIRNQISISLDR